MATVSPAPINSILGEINKQTDRGAAIIAAAMLDDVITLALQNRLILNNTVKDRLFSYEKNGPLAHFSAKIDMAFAVGIITPVSRNNLHLIRRVRNVFAHRVSPLKFSDTRIAELCNSITLCVPDIRNHRRRYEMACLELLGALDIIHECTNVRVEHVRNQPSIAAQLDEFEASLLR